MGNNPENKFFVYAIVISLIFSILTLIYISFEVGKDLTEKSEISSSEMLGEDRSN